MAEQDQKEVDERLAELDEETRRQAALVGQLVSFETKTAK
jgi:hypothetical protein